jgi:hypothetical protein
LPFAIFKKLSCKVKKNFSHLKAKQNFLHIYKKSQINFKMLAQEITSYDKKILKDYDAKILETEQVGDYELNLILIQGFYSISLSRGKKSFTTPTVQTRNYKPKPIESFPLRAFLKKIIEWSDKYGKLMIGSHNLDKQKKYLNIIENSGLFEIIPFNQNAIMIKNK